MKIPVRLHLRRSEMLIACSMLGLTVGFAGAAEQQVQNATKPAAGVSKSAKGALLERDAIGKPWRVATPNEGLGAGILLLGLPGAQVDSANGAVQLTFLTDLTGNSPYPVIECALTLGAADGRDLEFTLDRGRIDVSNHKSSGAAQVRLHVRKQAWDITLHEPGSRLAIELYGRWAPGVTFTKSPGSGDVPTAEMVFLVVKGQVSIKHSGYEHALHQPPGPALMEWDSVTGQDESPRRLDKLPAWATLVSATPDTAARKARLERFQQALASQPLGEVLDKLVNSNDPGDRRLAVFAMGATDDLDRLSLALRSAKHLDVWDEGVLAFRHWIGRAPGQDQILYHRLVDSRGYPPVVAESIMQLLHSFSAADISRPETYETLIDYLNSEHLGIRGLAYWHLSRLVPAGKEFGYNPLAPEAERAAAIQKWKKLIPPGKLPPKGKAKSDN